MMEASVKISISLILLSLASVHAEKSISNKKEAVIFKAGAPVDAEEEKKYGFGSIFPNKEEFFQRLQKHNHEEQKISVKKVEKPQAKNNEKEYAWDATSSVLKPFPLAYLNKESGIIKTEEVYVNEFDKTNSCKYKIVVNISDNGEISVMISSSDDSKTRIKKHEEMIKIRILNAVKTLKA